MTITLRTVKGSKLTHAELDGNFTDLQGQIDNAAIAYDPVTITANTTLTAAAHANRLLICNSASPITLTLQTDALGGFDKDDSINVVQYGAGIVTIVSGSATLRTPVGVIAATTAQYTVAGASRIGLNEWAATEKSGGGGGSGVANGNFITLHSTYMVPIQSGSNGYVGLGLNNSLNGTGTAVTATPTNILTRTRRIKVTSATTTTNSNAGANSGGNFFFFADEPLSASFLWATADALGTGAQNFAGFNNAWVGSLVDSGRDTTNITTSSYFGVASTTTDTALKICGNRNSGLSKPGLAMATPANYPANTDGTTLYHFRIDYYPASTGLRRIEWKLSNLSLGVNETGTVSDPDRLPNATDLHTCGIIRSCAALTGTAPSIVFGGMGTGMFA